MTQAHTPLDVVGLPLDAPVGKSDFRPNPFPLPQPHTITGERPAPPHPVFSPQEHAAIVRRMLELALASGHMQHHEAMKALESLAEVERALALRVSGGEGI